VIAERRREPLDVGVLGCGTAGPAAALFLARAGHRVTIYERVPDPKPIGAGIILQPTGLHVLSRLGLYDEVVPRGARLEGLRCFTTEKKAIVDLRYQHLGERVFGLGTHRGLLFDALFRAVKEQPNVTLRLGVAGEDLAPAGRGWHWVVDEARERHGPHELVVVADGARSRFRDDTTLGKRVAPYPWGALWFVAEDAEFRFTKELYQVVRGTQRMLGMLPTGLGPDPSSNTPLVSLYWSMRADVVDEWRRSGFDAWKEEILSMIPHADAVLDQIESPDQVLFTGYHDVEMRTWNTRSVVYLGDAAHAMSPQLGQGCNLALFDAMTLADCLARTPYVPLALDRYSRARRDHLGFYQLATRWLTPFFQSDHTWLGPLRDLGMGLMTKLPLFNRIMARSMAGVMTGLVSAMDLETLLRA
jgi:2-polyprenyl-6-methoxyphenol hydroxylase-like FAD-dependent oxidoreductase